MAINSKLFRALGVPGLLLLLLIPGVVQSQGVPLGDEPEHYIRLQTGDVVLRPGAYDTMGSRYVVLLLGRNLRRAEIDSLSAGGVRLLAYLGDGAFIAGVDPGALTAGTCAAYAIEAAAPWQAENKATPALRQAMTPDWALTEDGLLKLTVLFFQDVAQSEMETLLSRYAASYTVESPPLLWAIQIKPSQVRALLREQGIYVVEPGPIPFQPLLDQSRALIHVDEVQEANISTDPPSIQYDGLTGNGVMLQVSESVWDGHPDFMDAGGQSRLDDPSPEWGSDHGTGVAGIMAGSGVHSDLLWETPFYAQIGRWRGMAPEASLCEGGCSGMTDASNHSFVMSSGEYASWVADIDQQIRGDSDPALQWPQIWAAGNQGLFPMNGDEVGYYSMYAPAKNSIAVGAVNADDGSLSTFVSSLGPTFDGRIKPDVMAPGSKNHLPLGFDLYQDKILMTFDYIRIYNARTGSLDAAWEFNQAGDPEGWFEEASCQISDVTVADGYLTFGIGLRPLEACGMAAWGWNNQVSVVSDPKHVIVIRYKMSSPAGTMAAEGELLWHRAGVVTEFADGGGKIRFRFVANDSWDVKELRVGEWGQTKAGDLGAWTGRIDKIGFIPVGHSWPEIVHPAAFSDTPANPESLLSAGEYHTCALTPLGQADCWGASLPADDHGQAADRPGPFLQVGAGALHSCGLKPDGSVQCWGSSNYGQADPQAGPFTQISVGGDHNCGLRLDGSVDCWGRNDLGFADDQAGPFSQISAGWQHTCGLTPTRGIDCWGPDYYGEAEDRAGPFVQVSTGWGHTCGLHEDGSAECWGRNDDGQAESQPGPFAQISAGGRHTCGLKTDGSVDCWGFNSDGQADSQVGPFVQISAGGTWLGGADRWGHTCGLSAYNHNVVCWGSNQDGQAEHQSGPFGPFRIYAYSSSQGTSEAAPAVTGSVALILRQFRDGSGVDLRDNPPLPSTIKAILVQTADDMVHTSAAPRDPDNPDTNTPVLYYEGPDFATGYGLVNIKAAVDLVGDDPGPGEASRLIREGEIDAGEKHVYEVQLTSADIAGLGDELKFTLAWDDAAGSPATRETDPKLVNDLDLYLIDPNGITHLPWTLDPLPVADCGGDGPGCGDLDPISSEDVVPAKRAADHRNNVEMVQVSQPEPGKWQVIVEAYNVPLPMQPYSLVGNQPTQLAPHEFSILLPLVKGPMNPPD